jgi:hypothetical protein
MTEEQRARERAHSHARYHANKEVIRAKAKAYYHKTVETQRAQRRRSHWAIRGVDAATVPAIRGTSCGLCSRVGKICLDHNHSTGKFRGWLCDRCNRTLGLANDDPALLRKMADYIEKGR